MNIIFANQKGGVGKTTFCVLLANFLSKEKKEEVYGIDFDFQASFYNKWQQEKSLFNNDILYSVMKADLNDAKSVIKKISTMKKAFFLIDLPGKLDEDNLVEIYKAADLVICPFAYDKVTYESTSIFSQVFKYVNKTTKILFIPNRLKSNVNYSLMSEVNASLSNYGIITLPFFDRVAFQRLSVFEISPELKEITNTNLENIYKTYLTAINV